MRCSVNHIEKGLPTYIGIVIYDTVSKVSKQGILKA